MADSKVEKLLKDFSANRDSLFDMIDELTELKGKIDTLFPQGKLDIRFSRYFEERIKTATALFNVILDIRKEVNKSIKEEIDLRQKKQDDEDIEEEGKIRYLAEKIESFKKRKDSVSEKLDSVKELKHG